MKAFNDMSYDEKLVEIRRREEARGRGLPLTPTVDELAVSVAAHNADVDARLEKEIQHDVVKLYLAFHCLVYNLSQARASKQSPGLADLYVVHLPSKNVWWHETKTPTGKQRPAQKEFQTIHKYTPVGYVVGGVLAAEEQLIQFAMAIRGPTGQLEGIR